MSQAVLVMPDSPHNYPGTLGNKLVGVTFHAAAHYVALRLLEGYVPNEKIKLVHYGSPKARFEAMLNGEVDACVVMEPWITLGEKIGCKSLAEGHYLGAENASDEMDEETFAAINRAVFKAVDMFNADKRKYLHYLIDNNPGFAEIAGRYGGITVDDFSLPRFRYTKETHYSEETIEDTFNWMMRWGLLDGEACSTDLVDSRVASPALADD